MSKFRSPTRFLQNWIVRTHYCSRLVFVTLCSNSHPWQVHPWVKYGPSPCAAHSSLANLCRSLFGIECCTIHVCTKLSMAGLHFNSVILLLLCQFYGSYNLSPTENCLLTANIILFMTNSPQFIQNNFNPLHLWQISILWHIQPARIY